MARVTKPWRDPLYGHRYVTIAAPDFMSDRHPDSATLERIRRIILLLLCAGIAGTATELMLLDHHEGAAQLIPLVVLGAGAAALASQLIHGGAASVTAIQIVMVLFIASGALGVVLHYQANVA